MEKIEYRVRPVTRFIVTRFHSDHDGPEKSYSAGSSGHGEFDNHTVAHEVAYALCKAEHERLGWPAGDERIQYPLILDPDGNPASDTRPPNNALRTA